MRKRIYLFPLLFLLPLLSLAQIKPAEGDTVNYRLVGFTFPAEENAAAYKLEIANGIINNSVDFVAGIFSTSQYNSNKIIATLPEFGKSYTWRITVLDKKNKARKTLPLNHFNIGMLPYVDTALNRLLIIDSAKKHKDMYIIPDYTKVMYDMNGNALWYLPEIPGAMDRFAEIRDLKATRYGTFTFLSQESVYEINYDGKVLWKSASSGVDSLDFYHHEFTHLNNGHYMVANNELVNIKVDKTKVDSVFKLPTMYDEQGNAIRKIHMAVLQELDSSGKIVWEWKSAKYLMGDTNFVKTNPMYLHELSPHMNSFYYDEPNEVIYMSFRNINDILKISHKTGEILKVFRGKTTMPADFAGQHAAVLDRNGEILMFNNNQVIGHGIPDTSLASMVTIIKEDSSAKGFKKTWQFSCRLDDKADKSTPTGGNAIELPDGDIMCCVGSTGRLFIVSKNKRVLWNAIRQTRQNNEDWRNTEVYRITFIRNNADLQPFIFH